MPPSIAVFRHVPHETLGNLEPALRDRGFEILDIEVWRDSAKFPSAQDVGALIVMGGPMGVYEESKYPFLAREITFIREMVRANKPALGICLGSQLIAAALGSRVYPNHEKEIGWYSLEASPEARLDPLFCDWPERSTIFQWHGDTFNLPTGAVHLFSSPLCRHQAFRYGRNVYGLQFHPEVDAAMIDNWLQQPEAEQELKSFGPNKRDEIQRDTRTQLENVSPRAAAVFDRFAALCLETLVTPGRF